MNLKDKIRVVENFPKEGISFKDITTVLQDGKTFKYVIDKFIEESEEFDFDVIIGPEARGFLVGTPMSYALEKGFVPVRKPGKLPYKTVSHEYALEYGTDTLQIHEDAIKPGQKVLIVDDLLATGGTTAAIIELVNKLGGEVVGIIFLIELTFLDGRKVLDGHKVKSIVTY